jgi:hypothetical protein
MMIRNEPSAVVKQLFEWVQESINKRTETKFNQRLLRYGQVYIQSIRQHSDSTEEPYSQVIEQILQGYRELYQTTSPDKEKSIFKLRIIQSLTYGIRVAVRNQSVKTFQSITDMFESIIEIEFQRTKTDETAESIISELETPLYSIKQEFIESKSDSEIKRMSGILEQYHIFIHNLMDKSVIHDREKSLSKIFKTYMNCLSSEDLLSDLRREYSYPEEIPESKKKLHSQLKYYENIRPLDILGRILNYREEDDKDRLKSIASLEQRLNSSGEIKNLIDSFFASRPERSDSESDNLARAPITDTIDGDSWRNRAYLVEFIRITSSNEFKQMYLEEEYLPDEANYQKRLEEILNVHEWLSVDRIPENIVDSLGYQEVRARIKFSAIIHESALKRAKQDAYQNLINADLDKNRVESYKYTQNEKLADCSLSSLLRKRGIIQTKTNIGLDGILISQYTEPKRLFLDPEPVFSQRTNRSSLICGKYNEYIIQRVFDEKICSDTSQIEKVAERLLKSNLTKNPILVQSTMSSIDLFREEYDYEPIGEPHSERGRVPTWESIPIIKAKIPGYDAIIVYGSNPRVIEFESDTGLFNINIQEGPDGNLSPLFRDEIEQIPSDKCLVTVRLQVGIRPGEEVGVALRRD